MPWQMTRVFLLIEDAHEVQCRCDEVVSLTAIRAAATTFFAASVRPSAVMMFDAAFGQDLAAFFDFGAFQPHDQRHVEADCLVGFDDGRGDRRAAHDAAEDVHQHGLHVLVGEQDAEGLGDLLGVGAAADVEEVGRLAAVQLDEVHRAHRQAGAVHQAADVAVELARSSGPPCRRGLRPGLLRQMSRSSARSLWRNRALSSKRHLGVERQQLAAPW